MIGCWCSAAHEVHLAASSRLTANPTCRTFEDRQRRDFREVTDAKNVRVSRHAFRRNGASANLERKGDILHCNRGLAPDDYTVLLLPPPILGLDEGDALTRHAIKHLPPFIEKAVAPLNE